MHELARILPRWDARRGRWLLVGLCVLLFGAGLGSHRALTDHEALLAGSAKQMVQSGDWLLLRIGDQLWLEKPPLPQWLAATCALALGGFHEWSMRLPFAVAGIAVVLLVARTMTGLYGPSVGLLCGVIQATSVYQITYARLAESDVLLQAFVLGAISFFVEGEMERERLTPRQFAWRRFGFWVCLGLTNLAKGVGFGAVLTLLTCGGWLLVKGDLSRARRWWSGTGAICAMVIGLAWPMAVVVIAPSAAELWWSHTAGRAAGSIGYTQPFWYYLTTWPTQLLPWTPFFLIGLGRSFQRARQEPRGADRLIWWWMLSQPAVLSLSSGKHHHYLIYALPACTAITAEGVLLALRALETSRARIKGPVFCWSLAIIAILSATLVSIAAPRFAMDAIFWGVIVSGTSLVWAYAVRRSDLVRFGLATTVLVVAGHIYAQTAIMPRRDPSAADKEFLLQVTDLVPRDQGPLVASGCQEIARHLFYVDRPMIGIWNPEEIPAKAGKASTYYVIARGTAEPQLATWGTVEQLAQSRHTRREEKPSDRYTLFRVENRLLATAPAVDASPRQ